MHTAVRWRSRRVWLVVVTFALMGAAVAAAVVWQRPAVYRGAAQLLAAETGVPGGPRIVALPDRSQYQRSEVQSLTALADSPLVLAPVVRDLHLPYGTQELAARVSASAPLGTTLIDVHATDGDATQAARLTNAVAARFVSVTENLFPAGRSVLVTRLTVLRPATVPGPVGKAWAGPIGTGLAAGMALGLCVVLMVAGRGRREAGTGPRT